MKHLKLFEEIKDVDRYYFGENKPDPIDPFGEEDWDEVEPDGTFLTWLKRKYKNSWKKIKEIDCSNNNLTSLEGIENLRNLRILDCSNNNLTSIEGIENLRNLTHLYCYHNNLTSLKGIENLRNLRILHCYNNNFSNDYKNYLKKHCKENKIILR
jgi:Leucine-rich repeat (LRR) protein